MAVRCIYVLAGGIVGLSARQFRNGSEETQGVGVETIGSVMVRYGSLADIGARISDVRFTPESGHAQHGQ